MALGGGANAANFNNTSPTTNAGPSYSLHTGDTLSNSSSITSTGAAQPAVQVNSGASSITSSGLIQATGANGIGVQVVSGGSVGTITNTGTVQTTNGGNAIVVGDTVGPVASVGTIMNSGSGLIGSTGSASAIQVDAGSSITAIINSSTIAAAGSGSAINVLGTIGTITNSGLVQSATGAGIAIASTGSIGGLNNSGTIGGGAGGIVNSGTISNIINNGQILAPSSPAIAIGSTGTVLSGITNNATGLIQGGPSSGSGVAIDDSAAANSLSITTAGTIIGAVKLGPAGDTLNVTGGTITGAIIGLAGSHDILNFNPTGMFTTGGSIASVDTINVNSSTVAVQFPVTSATNFDVAPGATAVLNSSVGASSFYNAGMVNVGPGQQTITGNYTQAASGALGITVLNSGAGALTVTGTATVQGGANAVAVNVPTTVNTFALAGSSYAVLSATTVVASPTSLTASSNNSAISFGVTDTGTELVLNVQPFSSSEIQAGATNDVDTIFSPFPGTPTPSQLQARGFLSTVFVQLAETSDYTLLNRLDMMLTGLTPGQVLQLNNQLLPSTIYEAELSLATLNNVLGGGQSIIFSYLTLARLGTGQTGLAAGDEVGRGWTFWGQPFGAITSQGARDGYDGYGVGTYGVALGGDTLVSPGVRLGLALTLSNSNLSYNGTLSGNTGSVFTGELDAYGSWNLPNHFFIDGLLGFAYNHYTRHDLISALGVALDSGNGGTEFTARIGAGYDLKVSGAVLTPYAALQQFHFNFGSYTTSGGAAYFLDSHVNGQSADITQSRLGARLTVPMKLPSGADLAPEIHAYWLHDFGSNQLTMTYTPADFATSATFTSIGPPIDRDLANAGIGVTFTRGPGWTVGGGYDFLGSSSLNASNFYVQFKLQF